MSNTSIEKGKLFGYMYDIQHFYVETFLKPQDENIKELFRYDHRDQVGQFKHLINRIEDYIQKSDPKTQLPYIVFSIESLQTVTKATGQLIKRLETEKIIKKINNWYYVNHRKLHCLICESWNLYESVKREDTEKIENTLIREYNLKEHLEKEHHKIKLGSWNKNKGDFDRISEVTDQMIQESFSFQRKKYVIHDHFWELKDFNNSRSEVTAYLKCKECNEELTLNKSFGNFKIEEIGE